MEFFGDQLIRTVSLVHRMTRYLNGKKILYTHGATQRTTSIIIRDPRSRGAHHERESADEKFVFYTRETAVRAVTGNAGRS